MSDLKHRPIKIGSNVSLIFENLNADNSSISDQNHVKATMTIKFSDKQVEKEKLRQLWKKGHSGSQIARMLGDGATRNSVLGKAFRLKLEARAETKKTTPRASTEKDNSPKINTQKLGRKGKFRALLLSKDFPEENVGIEIPNWSINTSCSSLKMGFDKEFKLEKIIGKKINPHHKVIGKYYVK